MQVDTDNAQFIADILLAAEANNTKKILTLTSNTHPTEIALALSSIPRKERLLVWNTLTAHDKGAVVTELGEDIRVRLLEQTSTEELVLATADLDIDDLTDLLQDLPDRLGQIILQSMELQNRYEIEEALSYPEDTAGGLMNSDAIKIRADVNVDAIHRYLRKLGKLPVATNKLMVIDRSNHLLGTLQVANILTQPPEAKVADLMNLKSVSIPVDMPDSEVADIFQARDLLSAPVVDKDNKLLGRITIDDVVDVIQEDAGEAFMARDGLDEEDDMLSPAFKTAKRRNLWLGVHLLAALASAYIIGLFEHSIREMIALAVLMPLVASMSGVAGSQTLTLTIRGMALHQINTANAKWLLIREAGVGIINGLFWGAIIGIIAVLWFHNTNLGWVIALTILINITIATSAGVIIPFVQKRFNIDPALAGHVALTALTDAVSFLSFLGLATAFLL